MSGIITTCKDGFTTYKINEFTYNTLMADINEKSQKVEPLFDTIVDLSESVSDLNEASRGMASKIAATAKDTSKMKQASTLFSVGKHAFNAISKAKSKKDKK